MRATEPDDDDACVQSVRNLDHAGDAPPRQREQLAAARPACQCELLGAVPCPARASCRRRISECSRQLPPHLRVPDVNRAELTVRKFCDLTLRH